MTTTKFAPRATINLPPRNHVPVGVHSPLLSPAKAGLQDRDLSPVLARPPLKQPARSGDGSPEPRRRLSFEAATPEEPRRSQSKNTRYGERGLGDGRGDPRSREGDSEFGPSNSWDSAHALSASPGGEQPHLENGEAAPRGIHELSETRGVTHVGNSCYLASTLNVIAAVPAYARLFDAKANPRPNGRLLQEAIAPVLQTLSENGTVSADQVTSLLEVLVQQGLVENVQDQNDAVELLDDILRRVQPQGQQVELCSYSLELGQQGEVPRQEFEPLLMTGTDGGESLERLIVKKFAPEYQQGDGVNFKDISARKVVNAPEVLTIGVAHMEGGGLDVPNQFRFPAECTAEGQARPRYQLQAILLRNTLARDHALGGHYTALIQDGRGGWVAADDTGGLQESPLTRSVNLDGHIIHDAGGVPAYKLGSAYVYVRMDDDPAFPERVPLGSLQKASTGREPGTSSSPSDLGPTNAWGELEPARPSRSAKQREPANLSPTNAKSSKPSAKPNPAVKPNPSTSSWRNIDESRPEPDFFQNEKPRPLVLESDSLSKRLQRGAGSVFNGLTPKGFRQNAKIEASRQRTYVEVGKLLNVLLKEEPEGTDGEESKRISARILDTMQPVLSREASGEVKAAIDRELSWHLAQYANTMTMGQLRAIQERLEGKEGNMAGLILHAVKKAMEGHLRSYDSPLLHDKLLDAIGNARRTDQRTVDTQYQELLKTAKLLHQHSVPLGGPQPSAEPDWHWTISRAIDRLIAKGHLSDDLVTTFFDKLSSKDLVALVSVEGASTNEPSRATELSRVARDAGQDALLDSAREAVAEARKMSAEQGEQLDSVAFVNLLIDANKDFAEYKALGGDGSILTFEIQDFIPTAKIQLEVLSRKQLEGLRSVCEPLAYYEPIVEGLRSIDFELSKRVYQRHLGNAIREIAAGTTPDVTKVLRFLSAAAEQPAASDEDSDLSEMVAAALSTQKGRLVPLSQALAGPQMRDLEAELVAVAAEIPDEQTNRKVGGALVQLQTLRQAAAEALKKDLPHTASRNDVDPLLVVGPALQKVSGPTRAAMKEVFDIVVTDNAVTTVAIAEAQAQAKAAEKLKAAQAAQAAAKLKAELPADRKAREKWERTNKRVGTQLAVLANGTHSMRVALTAIDSLAGTVAGATTTSKEASLAFFPKKVLPLDVYRSHMGALLKDMPTDQLLAIELNLKAFNGLTPEEREAFRNARSTKHAQKAMTEEEIKQERARVKVTRPEVDFVHATRKRVEEVLAERSAGDPKTLIQQRLVAAAGMLNAAPRRKDGTPADNDKSKNRWENGSGRRKLAVATLAEMQATGSIGAEHLQTVFGVLPSSTLLALDTDNYPEVKTAIKGVLVKRHGSGFRVEDGSRLAPASLDKLQTILRASASNSPGQREAFEEARKIRREQEEDRRSLRASQASPIKIASASKHAPFLDSLITLLKWTQSNSSVPKYDLQITKQYNRVMTEAADVLKFGDGGDWQPTEREKREVLVKTLATALGNRHIKSGGDRYQFFQSDLVMLIERLSGETLEALGKEYPAPAKNEGMTGPAVIGFLARGIPSGNAFVKETKQLLEQPGSTGQAAQSIIAAVQHLQEFDSNLGALAGFAEPLRENVSQARKAFSAGLDSVLRSADFKPEELSSQDFQALVTALNRVRGKISGLDGALAHLTERRQESSGHPQAVFSALETGNLPMTLQALEIAAREVGRGSWSSVEGAYKNLSAGKKQQLKDILVQPAKLDEIRALEFASDMLKANGYQAQGLQLGARAAELYRLARLVGITVPRGTLDTDQATVKLGGFQSQLDRLFGIEVQGQRITAKDVAPEALQAALLKNVELMEREAKNTQAPLVDSETLRLLDASRGVRWKLNGQFTSFVDHQGGFDLQTANEQRRRLDEGVEKFKGVFARTHTVEQLRALVTLSAKGVDPLFHMMNSPDSPVMLPDGRRGALEDGATEYLYKCESASDGSVLVRVNYSVQNARALTAISGNSNSEIVPVNFGSASLAYTVAILPDGTMEMRDAPMWSAKAEVWPKTYGAPGHVGDILNGTHDLQDDFADFVTNVQLAGERFAFLQELRGLMNHRQATLSMMSKLYQKFFPSGAEFPLNLNYALMQEVDQSMESLRLGLEPSYAVTRDDILEVFDAAQLECIKLVNQNSVKQFREHTVKTSQAAQPA